MSNIIEKPFSWANKIIRAVFRGAPNLITTSDLNRQIEALKKEMYVLQQASAVVISDLDYKLSINSSASGSLDVTGSYVFCRGVKFSISGSNFTFPSAYKISSPATWELRLYAKKSLVGYDDDFSKEISGAKFEDGTVQPAADHYVYGDAKMQLVTADTPDANFKYTDDSNLGEYICTLLRIEVIPADNSHLVHMYAQKFTVPMGKGSVDVDNKYGFNIPTLLDWSNSKQLTPAADDDWRSTTTKLWSRLYTLERRLYVEVTLSSSGDTVREEYSSTKESTTHGTCTISYSFITVGGICFASGICTFAKGTTSTSSGVVFTVNNSNKNELPKCPYNCVLQTASSAGPTNGEYINTGKKTKGLSFKGIPEAGGTVYWSVAFPYDEGFWQPFSNDAWNVINR